MPSDDILRPLGQYDGDDELWTWLYRAKRNQLQLKNLDLSGTSVTDAGVAAVAEHCPGLQHLDLGRTWVTDAGVRAVADHCPALQYLSLSLTDVTDAGVVAIAEGYPSLQGLVLWNCKQVTDAGVAAVADHCPRLQHLDLSYCTKVTDTGVVMVAEHCSGLQRLDLTYTGVTDAGVAAVAEHCPGLQHLDLGRTWVTDAGVRAVADHCPALQYLSLSPTDVMDAGVRALAEGCPQLYNLKLSGTCVTDSAVKALAQGCPKLKWLELHETWGTGVDPAILATCDAQQIFAAILHGVALPVVRVLFVGTGSIGKTWLFERCFLDRCVERTRPRVQTPDIDLIRPEQCVWKPKLCTPGSTQEVEPRVWDFGGQLVLHGVHETFLNDDGRTIYVLVLSANAVSGSKYVGREETGNAVAYWRRMIAHFGSSTAPVIVAVTQCDKVTRADRPIDRPTPIDDVLAGLTLVDDLSACDPDRPIQPLRDAIETALAQREGIRQGKVSPELKAVREIVERELPKVALVPMATFRQWCHECDVPDDQQSNAIRDALHYMGSLFYFGRDRLDRERDRDLAPGQQRLHKLQPDTVLGEFVINPVWLKHAAYRVFEESERSEWLSPDTLRAKVQAADAKCVGHLCGGDVIDAFLKLVELSFFDVEKGQYLLPRGLKSGLPPGYEDWPTARLLWEFVPESAFHRFIVRMHHRQQVERMGGGYAHGRDWVMVQHDGCRVVVSADSVNGVVEIRFDPKSPPEDRTRAFDLVRDLFAHEFIGKPPGQPKELDAAESLRQTVNTAKETDWVELADARMRTGMSEEGTLKSYTQEKNRKRNPEVFCRLPNGSAGRTAEGWVWRKVGGRLQFLSSTLPAE